MPELSRFYGITIRMYFDDHLPPHFHAAYGGDEAVIGINSLGLLRGHLPVRALGLTIEWASSHQAELQDAWNRVKRLEAPGKIAPLE